MHDKMAYADEPASLQYVQRSDLFPKKPLEKEDDSLHVPFPLLSGEAVEYLGRIADGVIALSNFRLLIRFRDSFINVPLGVVESVECRDIFYLVIYCKDATVAKCAFSNNDSCQTWFKRICQQVAPPEELNNYFAFSFYAWCRDHSPCPAEHESCYQLCQQGESFHYSFGREVERMKFKLKNNGPWRITYINETFGICQSYPKCHIVPSSVTDDHLKKVAGFRALQRFPSVVWRDQRNGAVLVRCSQPEVGWLGWRNQEDEELLKAIPQACSQNPGTYRMNSEDASSSDSDSQNGDTGSEGGDQHMLVIDCRSYSAAFANRAKGGGLECPEYYPNCDIQFMNLANIHTIRKSFVALRTLCSSGPDQPGWLANLENTKWLSYVSSILKTACLAVSSIDKDGRPVLVHCSDGWDRTPQIISLAEILLDPYYRTLEGFQVLIEREWLDFGHKFADRCGNGVNIEDTNERCPVFLQWLDCIYQLLTQFPCVFQFNEAYLVKLVQHIYSCMFGTFMCNTIQERNKAELDKYTASVWTVLNQNDKHFINHLYNPTVEKQVLHPSCHVRNMKLWTSVYLSNNSSTTSPEEYTVDKMTVLADQQEQASNSNLQKTRSCENLAAVIPTVIASPSRRKSDPSITPLEIFNKDSEQNSSHSSIPSVIGKEDIITKDVRKETSTENLVSNDIHELDSNNETVNGEERSEGILTATQQANGFSPRMDGHVGDNKHHQCNGDSLSNGFLTAGQVNGHIETEECDTSGSDNKKFQIDKTDSDVTLKLKSSSTNLVIESSTDTICDEEDLLHRSKKCPSKSQVVEDVKTKVQDKNRSDHVKCDKSPLNKLKALEKSSSISTSTSDISNSHVNVECDRKASDLLKIQCLLSQQTQHLGLELAGNCNGCTNIHSNGFTTANNGSHSPTAVFPTPISCHTPNSTCPPTPGTLDSKSSESPLQRHLSGIGRHLDADGLTTFIDPVQQQMQIIHNEFERQLSVLKSHLARANAALLQHASACSGAGRCALDLKDEMLSLPDMTGNGEFHSMGGCSNAASDVSWEQIDESDSKLVKWVPDHAVTHCASCNVSFGILYWKHHCRNCGNIFCDKCSNHYSTIPQQYLMREERVCQQCYKALRQQSGRPENGVIDERPMAAAASN